MNIGAAAHAVASPVTSRPIRSRFHAQLAAHYTEHIVPAAATRREIARWRESYPALAELTELTELPRLVSADPDAVLTALLRAHQDGSELAGAALLHQMLPKLLKLSRYARVPGYCAHTAYADRGSETVAAFLAVIAEFQPKPGQRVAGQLALNTLHRTTVDIDHPSETPLADPSCGTAPPSRRRTGSGARARQALTVPDVIDWDARPYDFTADEVLDWAVDHGAISAGDRALLAAAYLSDTTDLREVASRFGMSYPALRQRLHRRLSCIQQAVCTHLAIVPGARSGRRTHICHTPRRAA
ncbi:hypothetical protein [Nocardia transvalensis]|uniref:hypothetical protein n=1 Tax=Nocardia transvalensis TaxID=37333 RepID=UPI001895F210|nr:hypothetical protein [Nocardia transvalensis]MBF6333537.1 hypothetical protein [Nocardia transvalensis]